MADLNEPEETLRVDLLPPSVSKPPAADSKSRETVRIQLGLRQQSDMPPSRIPAEPSAAEVLTSPEAFRPSPAVQAPMPGTTLPGALSSSPKNETARIARMPDLPSKSLPTVQMKKTQPLIAMPHAVPKRASIAVAPEEKRIMPLCWVLLGVSAIILIIQIWTYLS
jgi:hypothetical protein